MPRPGCRAGAARAVPRPARLVLARPAGRRGDRPTDPIVDGRLPGPSSRTAGHGSRRRSTGSPSKKRSAPERRPGGSPPVPADGRRPTAPSVRSWGILTPSWSWLWAAWLAGAVDRPVGPDRRTDRPATMGARGRADRRRRLDRPAARPVGAARPDASRRPAPQRPRRHADDLGLAPARGPAPGRGRRRGASTVAATSCCTSWRTSGGSTA